MSGKFENAPRLLRGVRGSLSGCLDGIAHFGAGAFVHIQVVSLVAMLLNFAENLVFTVSAGLPTATHANIRAPKVKFLVALTGVPFGSGTFRHILWHVMFLHTNSLAKPDIQSCHLLPRGMDRQQLPIFSPPMPLAPWAKPQG
jgi:hypothetical protein